MRAAAWPWRKHVRNPVHGAAAKEDEMLKMGKTRMRPHLGVNNNGEEQECDGNSDDDQDDEANAIPKQFRCPFTKKSLSMRSIYHAVGPQ